MARKPSSFEEGRDVASSRLDLRVPYQNHTSLYGMATTKITITLPDEQIHSIRELVAAGKEGSVSTFIKKMRLPLVYSTRWGVQQRLVYAL